MCSNNNIIKERDKFDISSDIYIEFIRNNENLKDKQPELDRLLEESKGYLKECTDFYNNFDKNAIFFFGDSTTKEDYNSYKMYSRRAFCYMNMFQNIFITPLTLKINDRSTKESLRWAKGLFLLSTFFTIISIGLTIYFSRSSEQETVAIKNSIIQIENTLRTVRVDSILKGGYLHNDKQKPNKGSLLIKK